MHNEYKRTDIFYCSHQTHKRFNKTVTPYHVLKKKKCYPEGCISFRYHCRQLEKNGKCPKKYSYVGKNCTSCKHYFDEKIQKQPEMVNPGIMKNFWERYRDFEEWVSDNNGKNVRFYSTIDSVRPLLLKNEVPGQEFIRSEGYLLSFKSGYMGYDLFEDMCYAYIGNNILKRYGFSKGDKLEFDGIIGFDEGRLVFRRLRRVDFEFKSKKNTVNYENLVLSRSLGRFIQEQNDHCFGCERGLLVDVLQWEKSAKIKRRKMFCMEGNTDPFICAFRPLQKLKEEINSEINE